MDLLDDTITNDQINEFKRSLVEAQGKSVEDKLNAEFSLAWALVRSQQKSHIQEGIDLFQVLIAKDPNPDSKRAFLLYLAVGYFKISMSINS